MEYKIISYRIALHITFNFKRKGTEGDPVNVVLAMAGSSDICEKPTEFPIGLMTLASAIASRNFLLEVSKAWGMGDEISGIPYIETFIIDLQSSRERERFLGRIHGINPDLIGYSAWTPNFIDAVTYAKRVRQISPSVVQAIGGVHITALAQKHELFNSVLSSSCFDIAIIGQAEETFSRLILAMHRGLPISDINCVLLRSSNLEEDIVRCQVSTRLHPEQYPMPVESMDLLDLENYRTVRTFAGEELLHASTFTSLGCEGACKYCASGVIFNKRVVTFSAQRVYREWSDYSNRGFKVMYVRDDNFCSDKKRILKLAEMIRNNPLGFRFSIYANASMIDEEVSDALKTMGCEVVSLGVETGDPQLFRTLGRKNNLSDIEKATKLLKDKNIIVKYFLMVGLPNQTWESVLKTAEFIIGNKPDYADVSIAQPYPGTFFWRKGLIGKTVEVEGRSFMHVAQPGKKGLETPDLDGKTFTNEMSNVEIRYARYLLLKLIDAIKTENLEETLVIVEKIRSARLISQEQIGKTVEEISAK